MIPEAKSIFVSSSNRLPITEDALSARSRGIMVARTAVAASHLEPVASQEPEVVIDLDAVDAAERVRKMEDILQHATDLALARRG